MLSYLSSPLRWARWPGPPLGPMGQLLLTLACAVLLAHAVATLARHAARLAHMRALTRDIPGPRVEHIVRLVRARRSPRRISNLFHDVAAEFTSIFKFWVGPTLYVVLLRADDVECLMTDKRVTQKATAYDFLGSLMGEGLLHLSGEPWRRRRRIVEPCFRPDVLRGFPAVFHERALVLVGHLRARADVEEAVDVGPLLGQAVTDMVCHTVMAADVDTRAMEQEGLSRALANGFAIIMYRVFNPWFKFDSLFRLSAFFKYYKHYMDLFDDFTVRLLAEKRRERRLAPAARTAPRRAAFLDVMLDSTEAAPLDDKELVDEAKNLITAATGGSTDAVCFVLLCVALQQNVQDRIVQELNDVFGEDVHRVATVDDLRHLEYLERVIKETLRMFPSVPQFGRSVAQDMTLPSGYTLPAGAQVFAYIPAVHRDPALFPEPSAFDPDRFLPERSAGRPANAFLPFGAGQHTCIGQRYALLQIKTTVSVVLRHYRLLPPGRPGSPATLDDIRTNLLVTQRARGGYRIRLQSLSRPGARPAPAPPCTPPPSPA